MEVRLKKLGKQKKETGHKFGMNVNLRKSKVKVKGGKKEQGKTIMIGAIVKQEKNETGKRKERHE